MGVVLKILMGLAKYANLPKENGLQSGIKNLVWLLLSIVIIFFDQLTKLYAIKYLSLYQPLPLMPFFNLTLAHNTGAAFSFLGAESGWQRWFFVGTALIVSMLCLAWLYRLPTKGKLLLAAIGLLLGGALGNLWDRLVYGYVIDFIDLYVGDWHWPIFNIADAAICIGVAIIAITSLKKQDD